VAAAGSVFRLVGHSDGISGVELDRRGGGAGTPEEVAEIETSHTGRYLRHTLVKASRMAEK